MHVLDRRRSQGCHSVRLRQDRPDATLVLGWRSGGGPQTLAQDTVLEASARADQGNQVGSGDRPPTGPGGLGQPGHHREGCGRAAGTAGDLGAELDRGDVDSIGFVFARYVREPAGRPSLAGVARQIAPPSRLLLFFESAALDTGKRPRAH